MLALSGVDVRIDPTEVIGLIGKNGAGESSHIKVIAGVSTSTKASCWWMAGPPRTAIRPMPPPIARSTIVYTKYKLRFMRPYVLDNQSIGNTGAAVPVLGPDYQTLFSTKWAKEYGIK